MEKLCMYACKSVDDEEYYCTKECHWYSLEDGKEMCSYGTRKEEIC